MRSLLLSFVFLMFSQLLAAQMHNGLYGNEWIDYNQNYYKIQVVEDGIYRIPASTLNNVGVNVNSLPAANLQIFHMGQEIPVYVNESSGQVNYIEFYGRKHRGEMDVNLYNKSYHHFNPEYSAITDTAAYFLTWNNTGGARQYSSQSSSLGTNFEPYFMHRSVTPITSGWQKGKQYAISTEQLNKSSYEYGEGWGSNRAANQTHNVSIANLYNSGPQAQVEVRCYSANAVTHQLEISVSNNVRFSSTFSGDTVGTHQFAVPLSDLASSTPIRISGSANASDVNSVSYVAVTYPRTFDFGGAASFYFKMPASGSTKYLEISNINSSGLSSTNQLAYIYDITNNKRIQCFWDAANSRLLAELDPSTTSRELVFVNLASTQGYKIVGQVKEMNFTNYQNLNANYIIIYHSKLASNSQGGNPIVEYAAYRASTGFNPVIIDVQQVYDQFGYGMNFHPVALRNIATYFKQNWTNPEYVFLIGKGRVYKDVRNFSTFDHLIPTFGHPPSDNLLLAPLGSDVPAIPVGRLAATEGDMVSTYLQKIRDLENQQTAPQTLADRGWMKNVIHLGGGRNSSEQNIIKQHLNSMKTIIEGVQFGGDVTSFFKTSTNPIQAAQSAYLDSLIDNGVSLITFFGHSSANSFDFNLDRPENYSNYQKYPMIMSLGCYGGTIFENGQRISEEFVFEPQAGASVFLASVGASALSALNVFANEYYQQTSGPQYSEGAAKSVQTAIEELENSNYYSTTLQMVCQYMVYHGDPAFNFNKTERPDYYIDISLVDHSPTTVTTQMTEFDLVLDIYNLGKAVDTVFYVEINREYPSGQTAFVTKQQIAAPTFHKQVNITVPVEGQIALGINHFDIKIDSDEEIDERPNPDAENNNEALRYPIQILSDAILPVYPPEFAIEPAQGITLKASTGNSFANPQTYVVQIDTTEYFNSPLMQQTQVTQPGGLVEWTPSLTYEDSTVYYWRVSPDSTNATIGYTWENSSFIYLDGSYRGWNQSHFFQYQKDEFRNIWLNEPNRTFNYVTSIQEITLANGFTPSSIHPEQLATYLNGNLVDKCRCHWDNGTYVQVVDSSDLDIWVLPGGTSRYGAINCDLANRDAYAFLFETDLPAGQAAMESFLQDSIPDGFYVIVYTLNDADADNWPASLVSHFQSYGASDINTLVATPGGLPWAFFYQKGNLSFTEREAIASNTNTNISLSCPMPGNWDNGYLQSTVIGPAQDWYSFHWRNSNPDGIPTDATDVDIYGIAPNGARSLLIQGLTALDTALTAIDAALYPKLELIWKTEDEANQTSSQLDYWRVLADMAPEAALRPDIYYTIDADTLQQGAPLSFEVLMENISPVDMDSMLVRWQVLGTNDIGYKRIAPLAAGDTMTTTLLVSPTVDLSGPQQLFVEINPDNDQPEQFHFNNIALKSFYVERDRINPLLDVTFDGVRIMNGDIVSGQPDILVTLTDENRYLKLDELEDFRLILRHPFFPNGEIGLDNALAPDVVRSLQFLPADATPGGENKARIELDLDLEWDGTYTLFVSGTDKSGNNSGNLDYSVDFEVINKPMISNVLNYPNPFTTQTQFVFTLTGREVPEYFKIQIMTVTGKIVREITKDELGPLHVGLNRTEFAWDGTDQFGDRLANGVYLYRVIAKSNKEDNYDMELYNTRASQYFQRGFGKMYLMR